MRTTINYSLALFLSCTLAVLAAPGFAGDRPDINATTRIVYAHGTRKASNIFTIKPDGSDRRQLTDTQAKDWEPVWSPDGTGQTRLTNHPAKDKRSSWSPDGSRICFQGYSTGHWELYTMNPDGSDIRRITSGTADSKHPNWSGYLK